MEKAAVRTSTDATFVLQIIVPSNQIPGRIVSVENRIARIRGGASGLATAGAGSPRTFCAPTVRFDGTATGLLEHAPSSAPQRIGTVKIAVPKGFGRTPKHFWPDMEVLEPLSAPAGEQPSLVPLLAPRPPRVDLLIRRGGVPSLLDWLITLAGIWIVTGLFIDAHQHLFLAVESFLNPWHLTMYTGGIAAALILGVTIARGYRSTGSFWKAIPPGYVQSVFGVAALLVGGALDFVWHGFFGFEHQLDLLLSPPHLFLLTGLFFLVTGPVRSAFRRGQSERLVDQLPMILCLGLAFQIIQFVTQFGFYPEALRRDHPLSQIALPHEQFVLSVFLFYRQALEISIVLWQSVLLAAAVLYLTARRRPLFGALVVLCVAQKLWIGGELANDWTELALVVMASVTAGLLGDLIAAMFKPSLRNANAFRLLAFVVPAAYFAAYFAFAVPMFGGTWWDASFVFGSIAEAGLVGLCVSQLFLAGWQSNATAS